jgi:hypothetical protein
MFKWIKRCIDTFTEFDKVNSNTQEEFTVDVAKENYQKYLEDLEEKRRAYIEKLQNRIKDAARSGHTSIKTKYVGTEDFLTFEYMDKELRNYFTTRGFKATMHVWPIDSSYLEISWKEE